MTFERSSGILLHPTSLPGEFGIGTLGREARHWVDFLAKSHQKLWQILPLGPTGYANSPYQCYSAFAGNPLLIDLEMLVRDGWLEPEALHQRPHFNAHSVDYEHVMAHKLPLLKRAFSHFKAASANAPVEGWDAFARENAFWLDDYALFIALHEHFDGISWLEWNRGLLTRDSGVLAHYSELLHDAVAFQKFLQFIFYRQWMALKAYANSHSVKIIGDIPIYVSLESADVWTHPHLFQLDEARQPLHVAGVPPDYFSATGQRWGNPLFDWKAMEQENFAWWIERIRTNLKLYDYVRIDHFRGFEAYWSIPAQEKTAINGEWIKAPGTQLFTAIKAALGTIPVIAEDLGIITEEVEALRDSFELPGMKILQFAFDGNPANGYLPHNAIRNCIYYTGTHDNNTVLGWFYGPEGDHDTKQFAMQYLNAEEHSLHWDFIRGVLASVAQVAIMPLQDVIGLGAECRMNTPGVALGNWEWRYEEHMLGDELRYRLSHMTRMYGR